MEEQCTWGKRSCWEELEGVEAVVGMYYIRRKKDDHQKIDFCVLTLNSFLLIEFAL